MSPPLRTTRPGQSALLLLDAVDVLARERLDYVVIGTFALAVHGVIRATTGADAMVRASSARLRRAVPAFRAAGFGVRWRTGDPDDPVPAVLQVTDDHGNLVDLLAAFRGLDPGTFERGLEVPLRNGVLRVASREDFIALKCFAGGPRDLDDARRAAAHGDAPLDLARLRSAARRLGPDASRHLEALLREPGTD
jgi:hypothetical protein